VDQQFVLWRVLFLQSSVVANIFHLLADGQCVETENRSDVRRICGVVKS
jgi:hypothetical protein